MDQNISNILEGFTKNFNVLSSNIIMAVGYTNEKLVGLKESIDTLNKTINEASKSSGRVAWSLWGVTVAGVLIALAQYFKK